MADDDEARPAQSYNMLKEKLFDEEMTNIKDQLRALRAGTHKDYERNAKKLKYQLDSALIRSEQLNAMESERIEAEHLELMDTIEAEHAVTVAQLKQTFQRELEAELENLRSQLKNIDAIVRSELRRNDNGSNTRTMRHREERKKRKMAEDETATKKKSKKEKQTMWGLRLAPNQLGLEDSEIELDMRLLYKGGRRARPPAHLDDAPSIRHFSN